MLKPPPPPTPSFLPFESQVARLNWESQVQAALTHISDRIDSLHDEIEVKVAAGFVRGMRELMEDDVFLQKVSDKMSARLFNAGGKQASQWLGGRLLTALVWALTAAGITWLVKTGKI